MKGFLGVADNEWCAYVTLLNQDWPKAQGLRLKAITSNWAKSNREFTFSCVPRTSPFYQHPFLVKMIMVAPQSITNRPEC